MLTAFVPSAPPSEALSLALPPPAGRAGRASSPIASHAREVFYSRSFSFSTQYSVGDHPRLTARESIASRNERVNERGGRDGHVRARALWSLWLVVVHPLQARGRAPAARAEKNQKRRKGASTKGTLYRTALLTIHGGILYTQGIQYGLTCTLQYNNPTVHMYFSLSFRSWRRPTILPIRRQQHLASHHAPS